MIKNNAIVVNVNTGNRIHSCNVYRVKGKILLKTINDLGAAFVPTTALKVVPFAKNAGYWFETNAFGLNARTGDAALTVLDENGNVRAGYKGYI
jgi:hypothetical protein